MFEEHGEIKTFFDLIANRGMVFVTYVGLLRRLGTRGELNPVFQHDIRAAERARERLQGSEISGRPVRVCLLERLSLYVELFSDRRALLSPSR